MNHKEIKARAAYAQLSHATDRAHDALDRARAAHHRARGSVAALIDLLRRRMREAQALAIRCSRASARLTNMSAVKRRPAAALARLKSESEYARLMCARRHPANP